MALTPEQIDAIEVTPTPSRALRLTPDQIDAIEPTPDLPRIEPPKDLRGVLSSTTPIRLTPDMSKALPPVMPKPEKSEIDAVQSRINEMRRGELSFENQSDVGPVRPPVGPSVISSKQDKANRLRNAALERLATDYLTLADADEGFVQGLVKAASGEGGMAKAFPFLGGLVSAEAKALRNQLLDKVAAKEPLTDMEQQTVKAMVLAQRRMSQSPGLFEKAAEITAGSLPYAAEFGVTGGLYGATRAAATKALSAAPALARYVAPRLAGVAAQTAVSSAPRVGAAYLDRMATEWRVDPGTLQAEITDTKQDKNALVELGKAGLDSYIENLSERTGGYLEGLGKAIPKEALAKLFRVGAIRDWMRRNGSESVEKAFTWAKSKAAFHGVTPEIFEEYVGEGLRTLTTVNESGVYDKLAQGDTAGAVGEFVKGLPIEDTPAMAISFGLVPAAQAAGSVAVGGVERAGRTLREAGMKRTIAADVGTPEARAAARRRTYLSPEEIDAIPIKPTGGQNADRKQSAVAPTGAEQTEDLQGVRPRPGATPVQATPGAGEAKGKVAAPEVKPVVATILPNRPEKAKRTKVLDKYRLTDKRDFTPEDHAVWDAEMDWTSAVDNLSFDDPALKYDEVFNHWKRSYDVTSPDPLSGLRVIKSGDVDLAVQLALAHVYRGEQKQAVEIADTLEKSTKSENPSDILERNKEFGDGTMTEAEAQSLAEENKTDNAKLLATAAKLRARIKKTVAAPTMDYARSVVKMSPDEFLQSAKSFNKINLELGRSLTPEQAKEMEGLRDEAMARAKAAMVVAEKDPTPENVQAMASLATMPQFFNEALAEYKAKASQPTEAQKEAGNYKKEHVTVQGLNISIENKAGSVRSGKDKGGNAWSVTMPTDYGYIKRTEGKDGDNVDVYVGPNPESSKAYIIDQYDPATGKFDEHKTFVGFDNVGQVISAYDAAFSDKSGPVRRRSISGMEMSQFKEWLKTGDTTKPFKQKSGESHGQKEVQGKEKGDDVKAPAAGGTPSAAPTPEEVEAEIEQRSVRSSRGLSSRVSMRFDEEENTWNLYDDIFDATGKKVDSDLLESFPSEQEAKGRLAFFEQLANEADKTFAYPKPEAPSTPKPMPPARVASNPINEMRGRLPDFLRGLFKTPGGEKQVEAAFKRIFDKLPPSSSGEAIKVLLQHYGEFPAEILNDFPQFKQSEAKEIPELLKVDLKADPRYTEPGITTPARPNSIVVQLRDLDAHPVRVVVRPATGDPLTDSKTVEEILRQETDSHRTSLRESSAVTTGPNGRAIYHFSMSPNGMVWTTAAQLIEARKLSKAKRDEPTSEPKPEPKTLPAPKPAGSSLRKPGTKPAGLTVRGDVEGMTSDEVLRAVMQAVVEGGMIQGLKKGTERTGFYVVAPADPSIEDDQPMAVGPFVSRKQAQEFLDSEVGAEGAKVIEVVSETKAPASETKSAKTETKAPEPEAESKPMDIIAKGDWVEYEDSYGKTHQGKIDEAWTTAAIVPTRAGVKTRVIRHEFSIVDADGKALPSPKQGTPLRKIDQPVTKSPFDQLSELSSSIRDLTIKLTEPVMFADNRNLMVDLRVNANKAFGEIVAKLSSSLTKTQADYINKWDNEKFADAVLDYIRRKGLLKEREKAPEKQESQADMPEDDLRALMIPDTETDPSKFFYLEQSSRDGYRAFNDKTKLKSPWFKTRNELADWVTKQRGEKKDVAATDENLANMSDAEFDAMLDEASKPEKTELPIKVTKAGPGVTAITITPANMPKPAGSSLRKPKATTPKPTKPETKPTEHLTDAAKAMKKALDEAAKGLDELFGGGTTLGSGPSFDEVRYAKAKPHFDAAWAQAKEAGNSIMDFLRAIMQRWGTGTIPYLKRWREDLKKGESDERTLDQRPGSAESGDASKTGTSGASSVSSGGRMGGKQPGKGASVGTGGNAAGKGTGGTSAGGAGPGGGTTGGSNASGDSRNLSDVQRPPTHTVKGRNYVITEADRLGVGSLKQKAADNLAAITLLKQILAEDRPATNEEKSVLVRYVGWGGLKGVFDEANKDFNRERAQLTKLLTEEEYKQARASIQDAHYTSATVIKRGIYAAMRRFGFTGGRMVEGGVGIGNFIGLMPEDMRPLTNYLGIERDSITAAIAKLLYPEAKIVHQGYQEVSLARESFDGAVGNPPFGKKAIFDARFPDASQYTIHNYFIAKTLELLRPGAVAGFVVSRYFLDNTEPMAREYVARFGEFLGAIRLPNTAFSENANTQVVTDLVFFRRIPADTQTDKSWTTVGTYAIGTDKSYRVNQWMIDHPEMVLGKLEPAKRGLYSKDEFTVSSTGDLGTQLDAAVKRLPENVYEPIEQRQLDRFTPAAEVPNHVRVGSYFMDGERLMRRLPDFNTERQVEQVSVKPAVYDRIRGMITVRDALNDLIRLEMDQNANADEIESARTELNRVYDAFVKNYGYINSNTNRRAFYDDTDAMRLLGLEREYSPGLGAATAKKKGVEPIPAKALKAAIFSKRVNAPYSEIVKVETPKEALIVSMNQRGRVDMDYMAGLLGMDANKLASELGDLVFKLPEGGYESREVYLSGNVREKLFEAIEAEKRDPSLRLNIEALQKVLPKDIPASDISAPVGAPWVDAEDVKQFAQELVGVTPTIVLYRKSDAGWSFELHDSSTQTTQRWGTPRMPFGRLFATMLNGRPPTVWDVIENADGSETRVVNDQETAAAESKASEIREKWAEWLWRDDARRERLARKYNDTYNNFVDYSADGSHLTLPGSSSAIELRAHQKNVAWRIITSAGGGLLMDHVVGAGKTFAGVAGMMELRRLGRVRKWLVTCPNHLTGQWADAFMALYPNANVLAAKPSDFSKENRQRLFARILTGDFDAVVLGHTSLKKIGTSPEVEKGILEEMQREIVETIEELRKAESGSGRKRNSRQLSQMERTRDNIKAKLDRLSHMGDRDTVATFEELGFDGLFVDESHEFKNLFYTTQMQNVAGLGDPSGSAKAFDLYLKTRYLRERYGGKAPLVFATGTPLSNSLVEMFTMQRYLQPDVLASMGLKTLDAWARVFGDIRQVHEVDPTGTGYRMATRFASFQNVGDLTGAYRNMADVMLMSDLQAQEEAKGKRFPVPRIEGGKPQNIVAERTPEQAEYFGVETQLTNPDGTGMVDSDGNPVTGYAKGTILWRVDNMPDDPREDNMLKLTNDARKAGLDMRMIDPGAPDRPQSKINMAVRNIVDIHRKWASERGTQLVFCDLSIPKSAAEKINQRIYYRTKDGRKIATGKGRLLSLENAPDWAEFWAVKQPEGFTVIERNTGVEVASASGRTAAIKAAMESAGLALYSKLESTFARTGELTDDQVEAWKGEQEEDEEGGDDGITMDELLALQSQFSVYDDMKAKLLAAGIPENEVAFIHDYDTPEKKQKLFKAMNEGQIRILFGSTAKMGAGTNVQRRIVALHHMDAPWRPSDLEQREGRAIRQGNLFYERWMYPNMDEETGERGEPRYKTESEYEKDTNPDAFALKVYRYATALTYDTRMWQLIEHKAVGFEAFRRADRNTRILDDVSGEAANAADMKAAASGDPMIAREIELRTTRKKLELLKAAYNRNQVQLRGELSYYQNYEQQWQSEVDDLKNRIAIRDANTKRDEEGKVVFEFELPDGNKTDEKGTAIALAEQNIKDGRIGLLGTYRGFKIAMTLRVGFRDGKGIKIAEFNWAMDPKDFTRGPMITSYAPDEVLSGVGFFTRVDNWLAGFQDRIEAADRQKEYKAKKLAEIQQEVARPFAKEEDLRKAVEEHDLVRTELMNKKKKKNPPQSPQALPLEGWDEVTGEIYRDSTYDSLLQQPTSADVVLEALERDAKTAFDYALIQRLKALKLPTLVRMAPQTEAAERGHRNASGLYSRDTDIVTVFGSSVNQYHTLLHELMHAATVYRLGTNPEYRAEIEKMLAEAKSALTGHYGLKNPEEFVAEAFSNPGFQKALDGIGKPQSLWKRFVNWVRELIGLEAKHLSLLERLIRRASPELEAVPARHRIDYGGVEYRLEREDTIEEGVKEKLIPTQVLGETDYVRGRERITPDSTSESLVHARNIFNEAGLTVTEDMGLGGWRIQDVGYDQSAEGRQLVEILRREIASKNAPNKRGDLLASLLNSVVLNFKAGTMRFDTPTREALYQLAQSDRSQRGLALGALAGFREDVEFVGQNVDVVLHRIYSDQFGGDQLGQLLDRVVRQFRSFFTDAEIENALKDKENAEAMINKILAMNRRDEGGRVYRRVQGLLKPKREKKMAALEADARVEEAVREILAQAEREGIIPVPSPNTKLPALRRLLLMVSDKNAAKIDALIANAVADAERNAGIRATLKAADEEDREELQAQFAEGADPSPEMIEAGLDLPEFAHWRTIRDNLLDYSPVTMKLVGDVIKGSFRGTATKPKQRLPDVRIDLNALAVQPDAEVTRVLDAYFANVQNNIVLANASAETVERVTSMIKSEVTKQLEAARRRVRNQMFNEPAKPGEKPVDEAIVRQINAGLFRDDRLNLGEMVDRAAAKSALQRLTPKLADLIKQVFDTPFFRQADLARNFAAELVKRYGISEEEADRAAEVFGRAFAQKFAVARTKALAQAREALTPKLPVLMAMKKSVWRRIEQAVNSGLFDTGAILRSIAAAHGWTIPSDQLIADIRSWSEQEQRLRELTPAEAARYPDPEKREAARREKEAVTMERRVALKKKIEVEWSKLTRPIALDSLEHWWSTRKNVAAAANELASANLLLKLGFAPRQLISVLTQGAIHTPTRAIASALELHARETTLGRESALWAEIGRALKDSYKARFGAIQAALYSTLAAFLGRGEARNVDRLMSSIAAVERIARAADEAEAAGKTVKAAVLRLVSLIRLGYRVAQALDSIHGLPAEYQDMVLQVERGLRELGKSRAEIEAAKERVLGGMRADWLLAIEQARMWFGSTDKVPTKAELEESAWQLVKRWQYDRIRELGLPADDFEEQNRMLRSTIGWNERETKGVGGVVGGVVTRAGQLGEAMGVPLALGRFGNAIALSINRNLAFTPFYFLADVGPGESGWFKTDTDRTQRKIEAAIGTALGATFLALAWAGLVIVRVSWPRDKEERDLWEAQGRRPGTIEIPLGDGTFLPFSLNTGPFATVAPYLAAGGALRDLMESRAKAQAKLDAEAAKKGVSPGKVKPVSMADMLGVAGAAAWGTVMGGRTAAGAIGSISDYGIPNATKFAASQVAPYVPGLPAMQEVMLRLVGVNLDTRMAGFWDFLLPLPTSAARKVNLLGQPAGTPGDLQRIVQGLTGGSYPAPVNPNDAALQHAYEVLFTSGYRPPSIDPGRGYQFADEYRPMTRDELQTYTVNRGQFFAEELAQSGDTPKEAKAAYQRANARALEAAGVVQARAGGVKTPTGEQTPTGGQARAQDGPISRLSTVPRRGIIRPPSPRATLRLRRPRRMRVSFAKPRSGRTLRLRRPGLRRR